MQKVLNIVIFLTLFSQEQEETKFSLLQIQRQVASSYIQHLTNDECVVLAKVSKFKPLYLISLQKLITNLLIKFGKVEIR